MSVAIPATHRPILEGVVLTLDPTHVVANG
jgi:hypothetical protein